MLVKKEVPWHQNYILGGAQISPESVMTVYQFDSGSRASQPL